MEGRALLVGDKIAPGSATAAPVLTGFGLCPPALSMPLTVDEVPAVRVLPAAEYEAYTQTSRDSFWRQPWKITPQSDRYGFRLEGEPLMPSAPIELRSHGIVPGVIQVPPSGQPIVQMRDAQPSGGYPKFGTVIEADLWRLGQAPIGSRVRFPPNKLGGSRLGRPGQCPLARRGASSGRTLPRTGRSALTCPQTCALDHIAELSAWLAAANIDSLELTGPAGRLFLKRTEGDRHLEGEGATTESVEAQIRDRGGTVVKAPIAGVLLHCHPMHKAPLAPQGSKVPAGQVLALTQIGPGPISGCIAA